MKKILFTLLILPSFIFAQDSIPSEVQQSFDRLVKRATWHGKDYNALLTEKGFTSIEIVDSLPNNDLGGYERTGNSFKVLIPEIALSDSIALEYILAHEIGEGMGLKHVVTDGWSAEVMAEYGVLDPTHLIYQLRTHPKYAPQIWGRYFEQL